MADRPKMNGAADRLQDIRNQAEQISRELVEAAQDFAFTQCGLARVTAAHIAVLQLIEKIRDTQTLAEPQNWRMLAAHDQAFISEILTNADAAVLRAAIKALPPEIRERLRKDLEAK